MPASSNPVRVAVIMAGGTGERFWPMSRAARPKQLLRLGGGGETMLQEAVSRIEPLIPAGRVFVATSRALADAVRAGDTRLPPVNVLAEPCKRNTSGCLAWAAANLMARHGDAASITMAVLTADHLIGDHGAFRACVDAALAAAERDDALVTIGVSPTAPDTAYGYIEAGDERVALDGFDGVDLRRVRAFREKPGRETAESYAASGRHYWNSGMFFWRVSAFLAELDHAAPALADSTRAMAAALRDGRAQDAEAAFARIDDRSIDYALMEKARNVLLLRSTFAWDDVGSWDALLRVRERDAAGNVAEGDPVLIDTRDSVVLNAAGGKTAVGVVGLDNVVVVVTEDGVLVASKDRAQDVRRVVETLRQRNSGQT